MKLKQLLIVGVTACLLPLNVWAAELNAEITDAAWDGKSVPEGQQCNKFDGNGMTPALAVANIPADADALVLAFDDRSYAPMSNGGHGQIIYGINKGTDSVNIPSVAAHTFDLPDGFTMLSAHKAPSWDTAGAYLPPCSGGRGNEYVVVVKAVTMAGAKVDKILAKVDVAMGRF
ncbi:MAG: hypothetical protein OCD03_07925 [Hyphomicrobiales bacterium]